MVDFNVSDSIGPYLPLLPGGSFLLAAIALGAHGSVQVPIVIGITCVLTYFGSKIIHLPFKENKIIFAVIPGYDQKGNKIMFSQTFLIKGIGKVMPGTNSALFTVSRLTKLWNWRNVEKRQFWGTATNFKMEDFTKYCQDGAGSLFGFTLSSGNVAGMLMTEMQKPVDIDAGINTACYYMTSISELSDMLENLALVKTSQ